MRVSLELGLLRTVNTQVVGYITRRSFVARNAAMGTAQSLRKKMRYVIFYNSNKSEQIFITEAFSGRTGNQLSPIFYKIEKTRFKVSKVFQRVTSAHRGQGWMET